VSTFTELLSANKEALEAFERHIGTSIEKWVATDDGKAREFRSYCQANSIGSPWLDSIESLLTAITAKLKAERGLSDAEIEGMRYSVIRSIHTERAWVGRGDQQGGNAANSINAAQIQNDHNACIDTLAAEIRRLRAKCGEVK